MALGCGAAAAHAESLFDIEFGVGVTSATKVGDGVFYSKGFSHDTPNGSYGGRVGIILNAIDAQPRSLVPGLRMHLDYENFGKVRWSSINPQDASNFPDHNGGYNALTQSCIDNNCGTLRKFDSDGGIQAVSLTVEPFWDLGAGWQFGIEVGPALYRSTWTSVATALSDGPFGPAGTEETLTHVPSIHLGALGGVALSKGPYSARIQYIYAPAKFSDSGKDVPPGIKGMWMLSVNYTF